jgi:hypothetical protein
VNDQQFFSAKSSEFSGVVLSSLGPLRDGYIAVCAFVSPGCLLANGQELSSIEGEEGDC